MIYFCQDLFVLCIFFFLHVLTRKEEWEFKLIISVSLGMVHGRLSYPLETCQDHLIFGSMIKFDGDVKVKHMEKLPILADDCL